MTPLRAAAEALLAKLADRRLQHVMCLWMDEALALEAALATPPDPVRGRPPTPAELHAAMLEAIEVRMGKVVEPGAERDVEVEALVDAIEAYERRAMPEFRLPENYGAKGDGLTDDTAAFQAAARRALDEAYELGWDDRDAATADVAAGEVRRAASEVLLAELLGSVAPGSSPGQAPGQAPGSSPGQAGGRPPEGR